MGIVKTLSKISLGLVLVLVWGWMYLRADLLFPINTENWKNIILIYIVFTGFVFSWDTLSRKTESNLFKVSFIKRFPIFLISIVITLVTLSVFGLFIKGNSINTVGQALSNISFGVIILHALTVAIMEELVFRGWLVGELKANGIGKTAIYIISATVFALFHVSMNREIITILLYIPLGMLFLYIKEKYSPQTNLANAGVHAGYNLWILGLI